MGHLTSGPQTSEARLRAGPWKCVDCGTLSSAERSPCKPPRRVHAFKPDYAALAALMDTAIKEVWQEVRVTILTSSPAVAAAYLYGRARASLDAPAS